MGRVRARARPRDRVRARARARAIGEGRTRRTVIGTIVSDVPPPSLSSAPITLAS
jgi:hypothetical protein